MTDSLLRALPIVLLCCVLVAVLPASRAGLRRQLALLGLLAMPLVLGLGLVAQQTGWQLTLPLPTTDVQAQPPTTSVVISPPIPWTGSTNQKANSIAGPAPTRARAPRLRAVVLAIALIGALLGLVILVRRWFGLKQLRSQAQFAASLQPPDCKSPAVGYHPAISAPICFGWRQPVILLPEAAKDWSPLQLEQALSHEMAHIRQGDWWQQQLVELLTRLSWWNPLCWYLRRCFLRDIEILADAHVIRSTRQPAAYARHLLALASRPHSVPVGATGMGLQPPFVQRLQTLIDHTEVHIMNRFQSTTLALLAAGLIVPLSIGQAQGTTASQTPAPPSTLTLAVAPTNAPEPPTPPRQPAIAIESELEEGISQAQQEIRVFQASGEVEEEVRRAIEQLQQTLEALDVSELAQARVQVKRLGLAEADASDAEVERVIAAFRKSVDDIDAEDMIVRIHRGMEQQHVVLAGQQQTMTIEAHERAVAGLERALEQQRAALEQARAAAHQAD